MATVKNIKFLVFISAILLFLQALPAAATQQDALPQPEEAVEPAAEELKIIEAEIEDEQPSQLTLAEAMPDNQYVDPLEYTLGPDDVIEITVLRHPEFSGKFPVNLEGKVQYKFVGDVEVTGLNKQGLEKKVQVLISEYVINPEVNVTILEYKSKIIYVLGEVGQPGKYYMRSESIPVREAVVQAGLPTLSAAMRRCRLITPSKEGKGETKSVDLYSILYTGNLKKNIDMYPGDVLYVPATVMAKIIRVINPVTSAVGVAASGPEGVSTGKAAATGLAK